MAAGHVTWRVALSLCVFSLFSFQASAATYFVRAGASGNGSSWASAWGNLGSISWSGKTAGDVICIAGGTYTTGLNIGASGASGNPIVVKRAVASDTSCGSSTAGWSSAFDSQVVLNPATIGLSHNYVTIDGMVPNGISVAILNSGSEYVGISVSGPTTGIALRHIEAAGPCPNGQGCAQSGDHRPISLTSWNGSNYDQQTNMLIQYVNFHGACNNLVLYASNNVVIEHSRFADSNTTGDTSFCHPNVVNAGDGTVTFRYNEVTNWQVEGIMICPNGGCNAQWQIYGNIWHDPMPGSYPRIIEPQYNANGPHLFYNNTIVNDYYNCAGGANGGSFASGSKAYNNVFWGNNFADCGIPTEDYDYSNGSLAGQAHGQGNAGNPFVNLTGKNFHPSAHTNSGLALNAPFNVDYEGNTRGAGGIWDRGAFQFQNGGTVPAPPSNLTDKVQ